MAASQNQDSKPISDDERKKLAQKLDDDLNEYIDNLPKQRYKDGWTEDNWETELEKHPFLMTKAPKEGDELPPLMQALQQLKYDPNENTSDELATNYKADGNQNFKLKKYKWAIDSYTEGIKQKCENDLLNAQLYTNRAAAHYHLGNFRSSLNDVEKAINSKKDHDKAILRGALCCMKLSLFKEAIEWCKKGLELNLNEKEFRDLIESAEKNMKVQERDNRKRGIKNKNLKESEAALIKAIKDRGIRISKDQNDDVLQCIEPIHPAAAEHRVHFDDTKESLIWPVIFVYPEYGQTDFISNFHENSRFIDHFNVMFNDRPPWDAEFKYIPKNIIIYSEDTIKGTFYEVKSISTLKKELTNEKTVVHSGVPTFLLMVRGSKFAETFKSNSKQK